MIARLSSTHAHTYTDIVIGTTCVFPLMWLLGSEGTAALGLSQEVLHAHTHTHTNTNAHAHAHIPGNPGNVRACVCVRMWPSYAFICSFFF